MSRVALALLFVTSAALASERSSAPTGRAEELIRRAQLERDATLRYKLADEALLLVDEAAQKSPRDATLLLLRASALTIHDPEQPDQCRAGYCERARDALLAARALDREGVYASKIANELGLVYSKLGGFAEALAEYDRALHLVDGQRRAIDYDDESTRGTLYGNSAETLMAMGRLEEAIQRYSYARDVAAPGSLEWILANYGLAVALDRDDQGEAARAAMRRALDSDQTLQLLSDEGVFFEPRGDKHYYVALGHEVAGDHRRAAMAWKEYLSAFPRGRWSGRARQHLDSLRVRNAPTGEVIVFEPIPEGPHRRTAQEVSNRLVRLYIDQINLCFERTLHDEPRARGEGAILFQLNWVGVLDHRVLGNPDFRGQLMPPAATTLFKNCLLRSVSMWRFNATAFDPSPDEQLIGEVWKVGFNLSPGRGK
jgi:tetratricopeptide (TPR) repeat protein